MSRIEYNQRQVIFHGSAGSPAERTPIMGLGLMELAALLLSLVTFVPWLIALIDILRSQFTENNKLIWLLTVVFVPVVGWVAYFAIGRAQKRPAAQP